MKKKFTILFILFISQFAKAQELKLFKDIYPGPIGSSPYKIVAMQDKLYFTTLTNLPNNKAPLWVTDGVDSSEKETYVFKNLNGGFLPSIGNASVIKDNFLFFYADSETPLSLFSSDGTTSGTQKIKTFDPSSINYGGSSIYGVYNDKLYFLANSDSFGIELWVSDGTEVGTKHLKDINKTGNSAPYSFFVFDDYLFFSAEGTAKNRQLWKTDGTEQGTFLVKDFSLIGGLLSSIHIVFQNKLILSVLDSIHGYELWETDGTELGTKLLKDINPTGNSNPNSFKIFKNKMFFTADNGVHGREIWISDGTEAGTQLFMDINKSNENKYPYEFHEMNGMLYFSAYDEINGFEVWKTDGTEVGTKILKNIVADKNKMPYNFLSIGEKMFFIADAGNIGDEVYVTDGTETGTKIIEPQYRTELKPLRNSPLFIFKEKLYVIGDYEADYGEELYVYDPKESNSGIKSVKTKTSYVFPNPAQNEIRIKNNSFTKLDIYDVNGRLILQSNNLKESKSIDISSVPAGIYIVKMGNENTQITERLIKY